MEQEDKISLFDKLLRFLGNTFEKVFDNPFVIKHWKIIRIPLWLVFFILYYRYIYHGSNIIIGWLIILYFFILFCAELLKLKNT